MSELITLPLLPLRDVVVFPNMVVPLFVGRPKSVKALEIANEIAKQAGGDKRLMLVSQRFPHQDDLHAKDLYGIGCVAKIIQVLKMPDNTVKVLVEGQYRAKIHQIDELKTHFMSSVELLQPTETIEDEQSDDYIHMEGLRRSLKNQFELFVKSNKKIPPEVLNALSQIENIDQLVDTIISHLPIKLEEKQHLLELLDVAERIEETVKHIAIELDIINVEKRVRGRVKNQMEKNQREYYLNEQVKAIQRELGKGEEDQFEELEEKLSKAQLSTEARKKADSELKKLKMQPSGSHESATLINYLETLSNLPWKKRTKVSKDLSASQAILDEDHFGLEKIKERIVEYLAVQHRVENSKAPILCLVGPPGVGKTSLGQSIARATNRKYIRMALGGVHDEAEIRGHRRTYISALPGRIIENMIKSGVKNPLFLLDEIDKLGRDHRGDPAAALLEVLDPEQNHAFVDHFVEVGFDLSEVMFIATANSMNIPPALLDRMEVIRLAGYTEDEKLNIARNYLIPKQVKDNGLKPEEIEITDDALLSVLRHYTREAGVRKLEREISKICRKVVREILSDQEAFKKAEAEKAKKPTRRKAGEPAPKTKKTKLELPLFKKVVNAENLDNYLGVQRYTYGIAEKENQIGQVNGLAWTEVGGEMLPVECGVFSGNGKIIHTGQLGSVMQESVQAGLSVVRSRNKRLGIADDFVQKSDIHMHFPEGAIPKDGPSAGIAICTALISALTKIPVRCDVAMTGEITLRGEVLAIGGLKEKLLAALRASIKTVLIPKDNVKDLADIPENIKSGLEIKPVKWIDEVIQIALESQPIPLVENIETATAPTTSNDIKDDVLKSVDPIQATVEKPKRGRKPRTIS